jgi:hypothetical protein
MLEHMTEGGREAGPVARVEFFERNGHGRRGSVQQFIRGQREELVELRTE